LSDAATQGVSQTLQQAASGVQGAVHSTLQSAVQGAGELAQAAGVAAGQAGHAVGQAVGSSISGMDLTALAALAAALGWASGLRLYAVVFLTGLAGYLGWVPLPSGLNLLENPIVLGASGLMLLVEFLADKVPGIDTAWDTVHTFIRIPAGAALAAGVFGGDHQSWALVAALAGGTLAASSHAAKTTTRAAANASAPGSGIGLSLLGDLTVPAMLWLSWEQPLWFFAALAVAVVVGLVLVVVLLRFLRAVVRRVRAWFGPTPSPVA
jgi:hypothetical protein